MAPPPPSVAAIDVLKSASTKAASEPELTSTVTEIAGPKLSRERQRQRDRETGRQTDRQRDRQSSDRQRDRQSSVARCHMGIAEENIVHL